MNAAIYAAALRLILAPFIPACLFTDIAFTSPSSSWKHFREGLFLYARGVNLYDNSIFHHSPLLLPVFHALPSLAIIPFFVVADIACGRLVYLIASRKKLLESAYSFSPGLLSTLYLFNPLIILSCLSLDFGIFERLALLSAVFFALDSSLMSSALALAISFVFSPYNALFVPLLASIHSKKSRFMRYVLAFALWTAAILAYFNFVFDFNFLSTMRSAGMPNIGLHWYFFLLCFEEVLNFFVFLFEVQNLVHLLPLILRFGSELPVFAFCVFYGIVACLQSHPTLGALGLWISLLPLYSESWKHFQFSLFTANLFLYSALLLPTMLHMWLVARTANPNYFYAVNLILAAACIYLQSDVINSVLVRFHLMRDKRSDSALLLYAS